MAQQSRQTIYSNEDLNKPIIGSKSKTYTNKDLDIQDDFQPDDDFSASADDDFQPDEPTAPNTISAVPENAPDTWREGFINSITSGDALSAGLEGAGGFLKGAILDIPSTLYQGAKHAVTHPIDTFLSSMGPLGDVISGRDSMAPVRDITSRAGSEPEEFGRMIGQITGQPAATAGLIKAAPPITRGMGAVTEGAGRVMRQHAPMSGMIPRLMEPRLARSLERGVGKGLENVGQRMRQVGKPVPENPANVPFAQQVLDESAPEVQLSQTPFKAAPIDNTPLVSEGLDFGIDNPQMSPQAIEAMEQVRPTKPQVRLNPDGTYTRFDTGEIVDSTGRPMAAPIPDAYETQLKYQTDIPETMPIGDLIRVQDQPGRIKNIQQKERPNLEALKKDIQTKGIQEPVILRRGIDGQLIVEDGHHRIAAARELGMKELPVKMGEKGSRSPVHKETTIKNAPPSQRAKIMRGQHDPVDIFFENANDRRVFGAGQNMFGGNKVTNPALIQTYTDVTTTIAKEYGLPIEKARELVSGYNRRLRELSKDMPKRGDELNFKAPSFETYMDSALRGKQPKHPLNITKETGSVTIKNPVLKQLGSNKETMPRDMFDKLISEGWTVKGATLDQAWPPGNPKHPSVRVVQLSGSEKRPMIFEPPKPKP